MDTTEINKIVENANMIVCGYAFSHAENGFVRVINLRPPYHALVINQAGETIETNMDDIEISIVTKLWQKNKKYLEEAYA